MPSVPVGFRPGRNDDLNYIAATLKTNVKNIPSFRKFSQAQWIEYARKLDDLILRSKRVVAHNPDDIDHIYGYILYDFLVDETPVVHFVYVKDICRRKGIGAELIELATAKKPFIVTHRTKAARSALAHYKASFQPSLA